MKDQISSITALGLTATLVSDREAIPKAAREEIKKGFFQVIFISPEALFRSAEWRNMLSSQVFRSNFGFIVDEAHCIKKW
jgi:superfamily II DNA helicase RecQ